MLRIDDDGSIFLTRGDTAFIKVPIIDSQTGQEYQLRADDTLIMSVKSTVHDEEYCFQHALKGRNTFHIQPKDTMHCEFKSYAYDVQLITAEGDVYTVIEPTLFKVGSEVTV